MFHGALLYKFKSVDFSGHFFIPFLLSSLFYIFLLFIFPGHNLLKSNVSKRSLNHFGLATRAQIKPCTSSLNRRMRTMRFLFPVTKQNGGNGLGQKAPQKARIFSMYTHLLE